MHAFDRQTDGQMLITIPRLHSCSAVKITSSFSKKTVPAYLAIDVGVKWQMMTYTGVYSQYRLKGLVIAFNVVASRLWKDLIADQHRLCILFARSALKRTCSQFLRLNDDRTLYYTSELYLPRTVIAARQHSGAPSKSISG